MADDVLERAALFAYGRCTAARFCKPPEQKFAESWYPKIAGQFVRPDGMPKFGYDTRAEAIAGAREFKAYAASLLDPAEGKDSSRG